MRTQPFVPTPQNGRSETADGRHGDGSAGAPLVLALLAYLAAAVGSVLLYRRFSFRSAYLLSTPVLVMFALLLGEVVTRAFLLDVSAAPPRFRSGNRSWKTPPMGIFAPGAGLEEGLDT